MARWSCRLFRFDMVQGLGPQPPGMSALVLDTNIVLDLLASRNPRARALAPGHWRTQQQLAALATAPMREELARVLAYPEPGRRGAGPARPERRGRDGAARPAGVGGRCGAALCLALVGDPDDQMFIDLAVAHRAQLLSKDALVLRLARRLLPLGAQRQAAAAGA
jgi:predicted nucleic acid-binding protein